MMKKILAVLLSSVFLLAASPQQPSGTISGPNGTAQFGQEVSFDTTTANIKGYHGQLGPYNSPEWPMVSVFCFQDVNEDGMIVTDFSTDDDLVYGELSFIYSNFRLGGGWSEWVERGGGEAECVARLHVYSKKGYILTLDSVAFHAAA